MIRHATLRQLRVFEAAARHLSFTRAAEELHLTQPTVSIQLRQLAEFVGLPLFEQIGKRLYLTDAGRELLQASRSALETLLRFEMRAADLRGVKAGRLRVTIITTAEYFVPRLLGRFFERYPGIEIALKVANREQALERLAAYEDDLYVLGQPPEHAAVHAEPFIENPLVVLASRTHPLADAQAIPLRRLVQEPFVLREPGSGTRLAVEKFFAAQGMPLRVLRMELASNEAVKLAVAGGLGITVLSAHTLALERADGELAVLDVEGFPIRRQWYLVYPKARELSVVAATFLDFLRTEAPRTAERYLKNLPGRRAPQGRPDLLASEPGEPS